MAAKPTEEETRLDTRDEKSTVHDFVYRGDDMGISEVAQFLGKDWDDTYNWLNEKLEEADGDE